jgi:DNA-binding Xre family transcriptional regulator
MLDDPQIIKTPAGDELVVLPRSDYDALIHALAEAEEELADIAAAEKAHAEMAANPVPHLPAEVCAHMLKGKNRLSSIMLWRNLDAKQLADRTGISESELKRVASREKAMQSADVPAVARALDVPEAWIEP